MTGLSKMEQLLAFYDWERKHRPDEAAPKDHEVRELVNALRDVAVQHHASPQLRERIAGLIRPWAAGTQSATPASAPVGDGATQPAGEEAAYRLGWRRAAEWANRDDLAADVDSQAFSDCMRVDLKLAAARATQAQAEPVDGMREVLADQAEAIDLDAFAKALIWMGISTREGGREHLACRFGELTNELVRQVLRIKPSSAPVGDGAQPEGQEAALLEAVSDYLETCPCECSDKRRYEDGEHLSSCHLFDLSIAWGKFSAARAAQAGGGNHE